MSFYGTCSTTEWICYNFMSLTSLSLYIYNNVVVFFVLLPYYKYLALHFVNSVSVGLGRKLQFYRLKKIQKPSMSISLGNPSIIMFKSWNVLIHSGICIPKPSSNFGNFNHWKECFCISKSNLVWFFFLEICASFVR